MELNLLRTSWTGGKKKPKKQSHVGKWLQMSGTFMEKQIICQFELISTDIFDYNIHCANYSNAERIHAHQSKVRQTTPNMDLSVQLLG